jgi:hypothetical protein
MFTHGSSRALRARILLFCATAALVPSACLLPREDLRAGVTGVWAIDESEKVRATDTDHWGKTDRRNEVWDGQRIRLFGARNEIVACQVILEAMGTGAEGVAVRLDSLTCGTYAIANAVRNEDPFDFVGRRIEFFTESYIGRFPIIFIRD